MKPREVSVNEFIEKTIAEITAFKELVELWFDPDNDKGRYYIKRLGVYITELSELKLSHDHSEEMKRQKMFRVIEIRNHGFRIVKYTAEEWINVRSMHEITLV
jgi:hypothetical protein